MRNRISGPAACLSAAADFLLLLLAFVLAGLLRTAVPFGGRFAMNDLARAFPTALPYALVMVLCYAGTNAYRSLRCQEAAKEGVRVAVINVIGLVLVAAILSALRLSQIPRLLLLYFYILATGIILLKRILADRLSAAREPAGPLPRNILLIGSADTARRYYTDVVQAENSEMHCVGYLDEQPCAALPSYLGRVEDLRKILQSHPVDKIIIAQETQNTAQLRTILSAADAYKVGVSVVPVYSHFMGGRTEIRVENGLHLMDLKITDTCNIMGVDIAVTDMEKTVQTIEEQLNDWRGKYICVANVHTTVTAHKDKAYLAVQQGAAMVLPDGGPLSKYSREQGYTEARRVTGPDLMRELLKISPEKKWRHYFYGSTPETLKILKEKIQERYPGAEIAGMYSPPFRALTPQEDAECVERINATHPDFVWVGLGAPKQEIWMAAHKDVVQGLMIGVGAAFDYEADNIKRAPLWMQRHNLEWLYRLMQDPRRLFKRYLSTNLSYMWWKWRQ